MTSGTSPGEFKGRITLEGFLPSLFEAIYEDGGVFLFDELDAGDENLLTLLNSALANGYFVNQQGKIIEAHEQFVPVSAANTMGLGANGRYTGRNRLDAATLDRWAMGRIRVHFDQLLAEFIYWTQLQQAAERA
jgi:cobaltochelatase CobS